MYGHYVSSAGYTYHPPVVPVLSVADMIPPPPPPPGEGPLEGKSVSLFALFPTDYNPDALYGHTNRSLTNIKKKNTIYTDSGNAEKLLEQFV